jgi:hypothetical protein
MKEKIYNIFTIFEDEILVSIGYVMHEVDGTDNEKTIYLKERLEKDMKEMIVENVSENYQIKDKFGYQRTGISQQNYNSMLYNGTSGVLTEYIFQRTSAPENPLVLSTSISNGIIKIDEVINFDSEPIGPPVYSINEEVPLHYIQTYMSDEGLDLNGLILDDFIVSIQLLYNNKKYVSCLKLFMSTIDSISFLEYGEIPGINIFQKWLDTYCNLKNLNVSSVELWEYRNSLLHMTNPYSRKVLRNEVQPLQFYVSYHDREELQSDVKFKYFNLKSFIDTISEGIGNWTQSFNSQRDKFEVFLDRYDLILSDLRYNKISFNESL